MSSPNLHLYRSIVRAVNQAAIAPRATRNPLVQSNFRKLFEQSCKATGKAKEELEVNLQNAVTFMRSQHMHKVLLDRYNPLHDLTTEERIKATARRVGLDMPVAGEEKDD